MVKLTMEECLVLLRKYDLKVNRQLLADELQEVCIEVYDNNRTDLRQKMFDIRKLMSSLDLW